MGDTTFISVGYFLTRPVPWKGPDGARTPSRHFTLNEHLVSTLPSPSFLEGSEPWQGQRQGDRLRVLDFFCIDHARLGELRSWYVDPENAGSVDWDPPYGSVGLQFVREAASRFLPAGTDASIVGLSAAAADADAMARCLGIENDSPFVPRWLRSRTPPESGGRVLGFEPAPILRECPQRACSWVCEGLDWDEVERELGLCLNERGLLDTYDQAHRASLWLHDLGGLCGGDRWFPWRLTEYSSKA